MPAWGMSDIDMGQARRTNQFFVIPSKSGIQSGRSSILPWIPAFAGMTKGGGDDEGVTSRRDFYSGRYLGCPLCRISRIGSGKAALGSNAGWSGIGCDQSST